MALVGNNSRVPIFLRRLRLKDYKSIAACDISLGTFTALVGPNGAGKSNLIDSLRFVAESLRNSLEYAVRERGGIAEVCRRSSPERNFGVSLEMTLPRGEQAFLAFQVGGPRPSAFSVKEEYCQVTDEAPGGKKHFYHVQEGKVKKASTELRSAVEADRLYLQAVSGLPEFRPLYDALTHMGFYNLNPDRIRDLQDPDPAQVLSRDGRNLASILKRLGSESPDAKKRIEEYLETVVPGTRVDIQSIGPKEALVFSQTVPGDSFPWSFLATSMSDGTLRALGILVAISQGSFGPGKGVPLVGIEEPEAALHPAAVNALSGAILEAAQRTQIVLTSHSPELLDNQDIKSENIMAVVLSNGETIVGPVDQAAREALREGLYTPGELLRMQQIEPDRAMFRKIVRQLDLFPREILL